MKTYACGKCGNRQSSFNGIGEPYLCSCGATMHALDGVIVGSGCYAIWRDGREVWSGTGHEAVEILRRIVETGSKGFVTCDSSQEEKNVTAKFRTLEECQSFYSALAFTSGR